MTKRKYKLWVRNDYETLIGLVYEGLTAEGIADRLGGGANISPKLKATGLDMAAIRKQKRMGFSLAEVNRTVDWSFLEERAKRLSERASKSHQNRKPAVSKASEFAEIKLMLADILHHLTNPEGERSRQSAGLRAV